MALHYELELLEELISITLQPKKLLNESFVKNNTAEWLRLAAIEIVRIKKELRAGLLTCKKEKARRTYIRQHQVGIVNLQDRLYQYQSALNSNNPFTQKKGKARTELFQQLSVLLDELLFFFDQYVLPIFGEEQAITVARSVQWRKDLIDKLADLKPCLLSFGTDLPQLIIEVITGLLTDARKITKQQLTYLDQLLYKLQNIDQHISIGHYPAITHLLIQSNFNCPPFINYLLSEIHKEINDTSTEIEKWERLCFHFKEIKQVNTIPGTALYPSEFSVQKYCIAYLLAEKKYFKKLRSISQYIPFVAKPKAEEETESIHLQMSVEELGLLTNVQKQAGLLKNPNMRSLAKLLADSHRSLRRDKISWQNLYNCFSKIEMNTINSLDDKLITMVNTLRKMKADLNKK